MLMKLLFILTFILFSHNIYCQEESKDHFLGFNQPINQIGYAGGFGISIDLNILPVTYGIKISDNFELQVSPILILSKNSLYGTRFTKYGISLALPYSILKNSEDKFRKGLFIAPELSFNNIILSEISYSKIGIGLNIGYDDFFKGEDWALTFALGYGTSYNEFSNKWKPRISGMLFYGFWF
jgi:hypothetical protein